MHTIKLLLTYYLNISVQAANLSDCRIEKIDSVARIESKLFLPELECSSAYCNAAGRRCILRGTGTFRSHSNIRSHELSSPTTVALSGLLSTPCTIMSFLTILNHDYLVRLK